MAGKADSAMAALQEFCRQAGSAEEGGRPLTFLCGFAAQASEDSFEMQVAEGRPLTPESAAGLLGTLLGMYARDNHLSEEEMKGMLLETVTLKDSVLPAGEEQA